MLWLRVRSQTHFPSRFYYFLIECLRGRMNGSVFYGTSMGFRLGIADTFAKYIRLYTHILFL